MADARIAKVLVVQKEQVVAVVQDVVQILVNVVQQIMEWCAVHLVKVAVMVNVAMVDVAVVNAVK